MLLVSLIDLVLVSQSYSDSDDSADSDYIEGSEKRGKAGPSPISLLFIFVPPLSLQRHCCVVVVACVFTSLCCVTFCDGDERGVGYVLSLGGGKVGLSLRVRGYGATVLCKGQWGPLRAMGVVSALVTPRRRASSGCPMGLSFTLSLLLFVLSLCRMRAMPRPARRGWSHHFLLSLLR